MPLATESVWDYPRPPLIEAVSERLSVCFAGQVVAETERGYRVLETSHPPVYYIPPDDVRQDFLRQAPGTSFCEFKGVAHYWSLDVNGRVSEKAAWSYPEPVRPFAVIRHHVDFYASRVDKCQVGEYRVVPQDGDFYGGWITPNITGTFKGGPGTSFW